MLDLPNRPNLEAFALQAVDDLRSQDPALYDLLAAEHFRQKATICLVASSYAAEPSIFGAGATSLGNVTTDGYPGSRYLPGCVFADEIEALAIARAKALFSASHANVQPNSGTAANQSIIFALMKPGDTFMGLDLKAGGHLTHGSSASILGKIFRSASYSVDAQGLLDYKSIKRIACESKPKVIIAGASAYSRLIDYKMFREIADEVGAFLIADISHIAGLIATGVIPSPINNAHFTTTSTYKQLCGPKGGLILLGQDALTSGSNLARIVDRAVSPLFQDTPNLASIASKARAFDYVASDRFRETAERIRYLAGLLSVELSQRGFRILTGGTDNHLILIDLRPNHISGRAAEQALEQCGIIANRNPIPEDPLPPQIASGIRFGSNIIAARGFTPDAITELASLVEIVLKNAEMAHCEQSVLNDGTQEMVRSRVSYLCSSFPLYGY